ncbi:MAG: hypothetical protein HXY34_05655 [Candidatus Thorarchaeota archaeon]|nr:hypothetical protein [Candidatus Thorarchaeota archaeon]
MLRLDDLPPRSEPLLILRPVELDALLSGVFCGGQMTVAYGPERALLTLFAHSVLVSALQSNRDMVAVFLDSGRNYSARLTRGLSSGLDLEDILGRTVFSRVLSLQDLRDAADYISGRSDVVMVVVDSLVGALNLTEGPGTKGRARSLYGALECLRRAVNATGVHVLMTDHMNREWDTGESSPVGGNVLAHGVENVIRIERSLLQPDIVMFALERSAYGTPRAGLRMKYTTDCFESAETEVRQQDGRT